MSTQINGLHPFILFNAEKMTNCSKEELVIQLTSYTNDLIAVLTQEPSLPVLDAPVVHLTKDEELHLQLEQIKRNNLYRLIHLNEEDEPLNIFGVMY